MTIAMTTFEEVEAANGRAVRIFSGIPGRFQSSDGDGCHVTIMAYDVPEADENALKAQHQRVFTTAPGSVTPDQAFSAAMAYAEELCQLLGVPMIDDSYITFRTQK